MSILNHNFNLPTRTRLLGSTFLLISLSPLCADEIKSNPGEFFTQRIQPILASKCWSCHTESRLGGLRLDSRDAILKGGKSGAAVVPGDPDNSLLTKAIA